jgi:hypothetical protein
VDEFFNRPPWAVQPLEFPHNRHLAKDIKCAVCHEGIAIGPTAGLPSVTTCVICHEVIASDRPLIKQVLARYQRGEDLAWQPVYGFSAQDHVRFHHAAHVRQGIECVTCHGNLAAQTVAEPVVNHTMGFCVNCHKSRAASVECATCHK